MSTALALLRQIDTFLPESIRNDRVKQALTLALKAESAFRTGRDLYDQWQEGRSYTVKIVEGDDMYYEALTWLFGAAPPKKHRVISAKLDRQMVKTKPRPNPRTNDNGLGGLLKIAQAQGMVAEASDDVDVDVDDEGPGKAVVEQKVAYSFDREASFDVVIRGHKVHVKLASGYHSKLTINLEAPLESSIHLVARSLAGQQAICDELSERFYKVSSNPNQKRTTIQTYGSYGWGSTTKRVHRDPATVVLAEGQMERLVADLQQFLDSKELYQKNGFPYHRGYLLYGPPGTGKTSAAIALATIVGLDVYVMLVSDAKSDKDLADRVSRVPAGSVLLLEDVDVAQSTNARVAGKPTPKPKPHPDAYPEDEEEGPQTGVTLAGLLNVLDGAWTPDGLITIMTTNRKEALDPALLRAGRCDMVEEIDYLTDEQAARLVETMTGQASPLPLLDNRQVVPAQLADIVKRHITDMDRAREEIVAFLLRQEARAA